MFDETIVSRSRYNFSKQFILKGELKSYKTRSFSSESQTHLYAWFVLVSGFWSIAGQWCLAKCTNFLCHLWTRTSNTVCHPTSMYGNVCTIDDKQWTFTKGCRREICIKKTFKNLSQIIHVSDGNDFAINCRTSAKHLSYFRAVFVRGGRRIAITKESNLYSFCLHDKRFLQ